MTHLNLVATAAVVVGLLAVLLSAFGLVPGIWLIVGVLVAMAGIMKVLIFAVWNGLVARAR